MGGGIRVIVGSWSRRAHASGSVSSASVAIPASPGFSQ